jgi:hypothetical protein
MSGLDIRDKKGRFVDTNSPLADKPISVKLYKDVDAYLRNMPVGERSEFLRELIAKAVREKKENAIAS